MQQGLPNKHHRVLYVLASPTWGGGEQYVYDLMHSMRAAGCHCAAVVPTGGEVVGQKLREVAEPEDIHTLGMKSMFDIGSARRLAKIIRLKEIDILHVNKFADAFLAVWARRIAKSDVKIVMTRHLIRKGKKGWLYNYLYRRIDRMIFVSELARNEFLSRGAKIDTARTRVIHNGIADVPQSLPKSGGDTTTIAFVGRIVEEKGLEVLMGALSALAGENFRLKIIGSGPEEYIEKLKNIASTNGFDDKVFFSGFTDDVNAQLQEAEIGVLPSVVREGFSIATVEYMRSGLAVVATNNGAQTEYLTDGVDALLVPPSDAPKLATALGGLLSDPAKRRAMGAAARSTFLKNLTYDRFFDSMVKLYDSLAGGDTE